MQQVLASLRQASPNHAEYQFLYTYLNGRTSLLCYCPKSLRAQLLAAFRSQYPDGTLEPLSRTSFRRLTGHEILSSTLRLQPDLFPLLDRQTFDDLVSRSRVDPVATLLQTIGYGHGDAIPAWIEIVFRPASESRRRHLRRAVNRLTKAQFQAWPSFARLYATFATASWPWRRLAALLSLFAGKSFPRSNPSQDIDAARRKAERHLFAVSIRVTVCSPPKIHNLAQEKLRSIAAAFGPFTMPSRSTFVVSSRSRMSKWLSPRNTTFLLSDEELALLWHPPTVTVKNESLSRVESRELPPPMMLPDTSEKGNDLAVFGKVQYRSDHRLVAIKKGSRFRHAFIVGKTGMGKSTLLENLIATDIQAGRGIGLVDPHGDLANSIMKMVPKRRTNEVVILDVGEDATSLLGSFIVSSIQQAAMSRADVPEAERRDFYLYVDEFQTFATESFSSILSEARKYRIGLTIANQYIAQMSEATAEAVFGNVGSIVAFQVGRDDADILSQQMTKGNDDLLPEDLINLPKYTAYLRLLIDGMPSRPFSIRTFPPCNHPKDAASPDTLRRVSHRRYGCPPGQVAREVEKVFAVA